MTTSASLDSTELRLDAGDEVTVPLQIRNNGAVVEGYAISVIGAPAAWATVEPASVSLYPGTATTATITFKPPRSSRVPVGAQPFGVRVVPTEHPEHTVVPEGTVEVLPFLETTAELIPRTSQGRRARHQLAVDNRGNVPVNVLVAAGTDGDRVRFRVDPVGLVIPPGEARFVKVRGRPLRRIWRGQPVTHPFTVTVTPDTSTPVELDGGYVQTPVVPKWLLWALLALLALAALLLTLWFTVLKPTIESQAKEAAEEAAAEAEQAAEEAQQSAEEAGGAATDAKQAADESEEAGAGEGEDDGRERPRGPRVRVEDIAERLNVVSAGTDVSTFTLPGPDDTFDLTDLVYANPQGDFGTIELLVDGTVRFEHALENFRDLDYHFVSPIRVDDSVALQLSCRTPGQPPDAPVPTDCDVSVLLGGELTSPINPAGP
jgi:hypothetical protein